VVSNVSTTLDTLTSSTISTVNITASGNISAASFSGWGSAVTALDAGTYQRVRWWSHENWARANHEQQSVGWQR
jgi:hypothetical protein